MRVQRRALEGVGLAFLDVMACGLGAATLLFLLIKQNEAPDLAVPQPVTISVSGQSQFEYERAELEQTRESLTVRLAKARELTEKGEAEVEESAERVVALEAKRDELAASAQTARERASALEEAIENVQLPHEDVIELEGGGGHEKYLFGMRVLGERIAILVDRSASMTDERLVDIVRRKVQPSAQKKTGPKWVRTLRTARWLLNAVPEASRVAMVAYNDRAVLLGPGGWQNGRDGAALVQLAGDLEDLVPTGATNLHAALVALAGLQPPPTDLYVVTDGFPTKGQPGLSVPWRCRNRATVTGDCRAAIFRQTIGVASPANTRVNVILLPIEGDPEAVSLYSVWTNRSGGVLLSPAEGWP